MSAVESILRHAVENPRLQAEAIANTVTGFSSSPTIQSELDEIPYVAGLGHQKAIAALLQLDNLKPLADILLRAGLYEKLRDSAVSDLVGAE